MTGDRALERLLATDSRDVGCDEAFEHVDVFVELTLANADAAGRFPGIAVHLGHCPSCAQDLQGLLAAAGCD